MFPSLTLNKSFHLLKYRSTKARFFRKVENAISNSQRKRLEIVTSLAGKFKTCKSAPKNKDNWPMLQLGDF